MNAPERIGQHLPELLTELAAPRVPDYFDDMLRQAEATRQLPAWASLERWLPMGALARPAPLGLPSWRPIVLLAGLVLALAAAAAFIAGSQRHVPPPFGPARNGDLVAGTVDGSLVAIDPQTGLRTPVRTPSGAGFYPLYSPDGTRFLRSSLANGVETMFVVAADGTSERKAFEVAEGAINGAAWSPASDSFLVTTEMNGSASAQVVDATSGVVRQLDLGGLRPRQAVWRPDGTEIVFTGEMRTAGGSTWAYYVAGLDGSAPRAIVPVVGEEVYYDAALSPDGDTWVYSKWAPGIRGRLYAVDIDAGTERPLEIPRSIDRANDLQPLFSPDGSHLLLQRYVDGRYTSTLVRTDGTGEAVALGTDHAGGDRLNPEALFSPDGTKVVVHYPDDHTTWVYEAATGHGVQTAGTDLDGISWQRLAP